MSAGHPDEPTEPGTPLPGEQPEPPGPSPWSREYAERAEPRFAGPESAATPNAYPPVDPYAPFPGPGDTAPFAMPPDAGFSHPEATHPTAYAPSPYADPYRQGQFAGYGAPLPPGPPVSYGQPWPAPEGPPPPRRRTGIIVIAIILALALAGGITGAVLASSDSGNAPAAGPQPLPTTAPNTGGGPGAPTPSSPATPFPLPDRGLVTTPPGLLAIGYRAYSLRQVDPADVAIDAKEEVQFRKYGLSRVVQLRALTLGSSLRHSDDWDAGINVLTFKDAAGAQAELAYSNEQNKKLTAQDKSGHVIALPGLPQVTAFLNTDDAANGLSVGAFATVGRYQVVVLLGGLSPNTPTDPTAIAAEAARVMKAVLPSAPDIAQSQISSGGTGPDLPFPTPSPSGTRA